MLGWYSFDFKGQKNGLSFSKPKFQEADLISKLQMLNSLLDTNTFEIYYRRDNESICLYDKVAEEFITENGCNQCNLSMFIDNLIET